MCVIAISLSAISYTYQIGEHCEIKNLAANSCDQHTLIDFGSAQSRGPNALRWYAKSCHQVSVRQRYQGTSSWWRLGLALAAELNGMPGPAHMLELKEQIALNQDQVTKTQALLDDMRKAAIPTGERLIAAELALENAFAKGAVEEASLRRLLAEAESARTELRFIHLSQHYKTVQFLKPEQIKRYNILRGYAEDPCKNIPAGHNPEMYKRHMGCS